jgi:hypothetical protein
MCYKQGLPQSKPLVIQTKHLDILQNKVPPLHQIPIPISENASYHQDKTCKYPKDNTSHPLITIP